MEGGILITNGVSGNKIRGIGPGIDLEVVSRDDACRFREKYGGGRPFVLFLATLSLDKEAIHVDGYLVPFSDVQAIAEAILALWRDENERVIGEEGYSKVLRNYTWPVIYHQIKGLYRSLTEG